MKLNQLPNIILFHIIFLLIPTPSESAGCNRRCGTRTFPFPFGFSAACQIQLNCTSDGAVLASDFAVQSVTADTILINLPANCSRPVETLDRLFTHHYAPSSLNAVLLQNCSAPPTPCFIPTTTVMANFEQRDCGNGSDSISCYSEKDSREAFLNHGRLRRSGCRSLFSAISMDSFENTSSVSLDVEIVRMEWWLPGDCSCSDNARCVRVSPPLRGNPAAYRCLCAEGFVGDGFREGFGCRPRGRSGCNISRYFSGQCGGKSRIIVIVGGVAVVGTIIVCLVLLLCLIRKRSKVMFSRSRGGRRRNRHPTAATEITIPVYSYREIEKATDCFSEKRRLGDGAYGTVYSGKLINDQWVAVKRLRQRDSGASEDVINEIKLISSVNHPNLVRLLGCSIDTEQILVYEFMPNGTLSQHLQREKGGLPWPVRLAIAVETARALSYLHNEMQPPIYHRDVKSTNILLDYDYRSKLADFGLSRLGMIEFSHVSTAPQGTPGYVDPQYHQHFHLSDKSDVYSFGVVLVEIITALRVVDFSRPPNEINLAALAVDRIGGGCLDEIIDPFILGQGRDSRTVASVHKVGELAFRCLCFDREMRPSMMEVVAELELIKKGGSSVSFTAESSSASSSSIKSLKQDFGVNSLDIERDFSPVSVEDSWQSNKSSPSSNSLLDPAI